MTGSERNNYLLAIMFSAIFHIGLMLIAPGQFFSAQTIDPNLDTIVVGTMELAGDSGTVLNAGGGGSSEALGTNPIPAKTDKSTQPAMKNGPNPGKEGTAPAKSGSVNPQPQDKTGAPGELATGDKGKAPVVPPGNNQGVTGGRLGTGDGSGNGTGNGNGNGSGGGSGQPGKAVGLGTGEQLVAIPSKPIYPKNALNEGIEGDVVVRLLVKPDGTLESIDFVKHASDARLDQAVINRIKRDWKLKQWPVAYMLELGFTFRLDSGVNVNYFHAETRP